MMDCERVRELLPLFSDGDLGEADAAELQAHLDVCRDCRAALADMNSLGGLLNDSLSSIEPDDAFEQKVRSAIVAGAPDQPPSKRRRRLLRIAAPLAVAAAVLLAALVLLEANRPAAALVSGELVDSAARIEEGRAYQASGDCVLRLVDEAMAFIADGSYFTVSEKSLRLDEGYCCAVSPEGDVAPSVVETHGLRAELYGAQVFLGAGPKRQVTVWLSLFPPVHAQEGGVGEVALLVVFKGRAVVQVNGFEHTVRTGQFLFADEADLGPQVLELFQKSAGSEIDDLKKQLQPLQKRLDRYSGVVEHYDRHLAWLEEQKAPADPAGHEEFDVRIHIVRDARNAHDNTLARILADMKRPSLELAERKARLDALDRAEKGFKEASRSLLHPGD